VINKIYEGPDKDRYFQKSRVFLYPVLETKRGGKITPINTFVSWDKVCKKSDRRLICTYELRNDVEFEKYEKKVLLGNELFYDFREGVPIDGKRIGIYIFDFNKFAVDWDLFIKGAYSRMKTEVKKRIKTYYNGNNSNSVYVDSYINPNKYYEIYSRILGVPESTLRGGELCNRPDFERENLKISIKDIAAWNNSVNLQPTQKPTQ